MNAIRFKASKRDRASPLAALAEQGAYYATRSIWRMEFEIVPEPVGEIKECWDHMAELHGRARWPDGGVFAPKDYAASGKLPPPRDPYRPADERKAILRDVLRCRADDPGALLALVNRWGAFGVGNPVSRYAGSLFAYDAVGTLAEWVKQRQIWVGAWRALQAGKAPFLDKAGLDLGMDDSVLAACHRRRTRLIWPVLAQALNRLIGAAHLLAYAPEAARSMRLRPFFSVSHLADLVNIALWETATADGQPLQWCLGCTVPFIPDRANQKYCDGSCQNRAKQRRHRQRVRARRTKKARRG